MLETTINDNWGLLLRVLLFAGYTLYTTWVVFLGGAQWLYDVFQLDWPWFNSFTLQKPWHTPPESAEEIRSYTVLCYLATVIFGAIQYLVSLGI
jgi:hypothetical protein